MFDNADNTLPWMAEMTDLTKKFFEARATEYRTGRAVKRQ
jgi:hypothetical protein